MNKIRYRWKRKLNQKYFSKEPNTQTHKICGVECVSRTLDTIIRISNFYAILFYHYLWDQNAMIRLVIAQYTYVLPYIKVHREKIHVTICIFWAWNSTLSYVCTNGLGFSSGKSLYFKNLTAKTIVSYPPFTFTRFLSTGISIVVTMWNVVINDMFVSEDLGCWKIICGNVIQ